MPRPPSWINRVQAITKWIENPCDAPWVIYLETAKAPLGRFILGRLEFGMTDVISGMFRPKGFRSGRHGRKGRRGKKLRAGIPSIPDLWASNMPGFEEMEARHVTAGVRTMWVIYGGLNRFLDFMQLIDLTETFFVEWASAINKTQYCAMSQLGAGFNEQTYQTVGLGGPNQPILAPEHRWQRGSVNMLSFAATTGPGNFMAACGLNITRRFADDIAWVRIRIQETLNSRVIAESETMAIAVGQTISIACSGQSKGPNNFQCILTSPHGEFLAQGNFWYVQGVGT